MASGQPTGLPALKKPPTRTRRTDASGLVIEKSPQRLASVDETTAGEDDPGEEQIGEIRRMYQRQLFSILMDKRVRWALQQLLTCRNARIRVEAFKLVLMHMVPLPEDSGGTAARQVVIVSQIPRPDAPAAIPAAAIATPETETDDGD